MDTYTFEWKNDQGVKVGISGTIDWQSVPGGWLAICNSTGEPEFRVEAPTMHEALIKILQKRLS